MCYEIEAPGWIDAGYTPVPLAPRDKRPATCERGLWRLTSKWPTLPVIDPRANVETLERVRGGNIGLMHGSRSRDVIKIDVDVPLDDEIAKALIAALPPTNHRSVGQRGEGRLYTCPQARSRKFLVDGRLIVEILAEGRQSVVPPSIHPMTKQPYRWTGSRTPLDELPPHIDYAELIRIIE